MTKQATSRPRTEFQKKLTKFLNSCKRRGKMTLRDHLIRAGYGDLPFYEFEEMLVAARKRLKAGGSHHNLLGTTVFPSINTGKGRPPKWNGKVKPMADRQPEPRWGANVPMIVDINRYLTVSGLNPVNDQPDALRRLSRLSRRASNDVLAIVQPLMSAVDTHMANATRLQAQVAAHNLRLESIEAVMADRLLLAS